MKILYLTSLVDPIVGGGVSQVVNFLANEFNKKENKINVVSSCSFKRNRTFEYNNIKIHEVFPLNLYWIAKKESQPLFRKIIWQLIDVWNPFSYLAIKRILRLESPDIIHFHKIRGFSPSVWQSAKDANIQKIVHTSHDFELISPQGLLEGKIGALARDRKFPINIYQNLRASASMSVNNFTCPSDFLLKNHNNLNFFPNAKKDIVSNSHGFSKTEIEQHKSLQKPTKSEKCFRLLFIGRLVKEKGIISLCESVMDINKNSKKIYLDVLGWGPLENELQEKFGEQQSIQFHGQKYGNEKHFYLQNCDVLVVPSTVPESFGIVITEAFAFGKPVIGSNIGAIPELIEENYNGFMFDPNNSIMLEEVILKVYDIRSFLSEMQNNCFLSAEKYCLETFIEKHQQIYDE